jgi:hypothetical protein
MEFAIKFCVHGSSWAKDVCTRYQDTSMVHQLQAIALLCVLMAGCSSTNPRCDDTSICVGPTPDSVTQETCNILTQSCLDSERCTWVIDQNNPQVVGHFACRLLNGQEVSAGVACQYSSSFPSLDNCERGTVCIDGTCRFVCQLDTLSCPVDQVCTSHSGFLEENGQPVAGTCDG